MGIAAASVENLVTRISLEGVKETQQQQRLVGAGFKAMSGNIRGAANELRGLKLTTGQMVIAGGALVGAGASIMAYLRGAAQSAGEEEMAQARLAQALRNSGAAGKGAAASIASYAARLQSATTAGDEQLISAAAQLASFKMSEQQIKDYLPRLVDMQEGLRRVKGEEVPLEQLAIMIGKGHSGQVSNLRRFGVMVDLNAYKTKGYKAILEELDKEFGGQGKAAQSQYIGMMKALSNDLGDIQEAIGTGVLPVLKGFTGALGVAARSVKAIDQYTHGWAGRVTGLTIGIVGLGAAVSGMLIFLAAAKRAWLEVAGAAGAATVAQTAAGTAGLKAGAQAAAGAGAAAGGGILGRLGGLKGLGKGLGIGLIASLAGDLIGGGIRNFGLSGAKDYRESRGKSGGLKAAAGIVGGEAAKYAGMGAAFGSIIPGLGTAAGAGIGAVGGTIWGAIRAARTARSIQKTWAKEPAAQPGTPAGSSASGWLKTIADLLKAQNRVIIGGGQRASRAFNEGDLVRAQMRLMTKSIA